MSPNKYPFAWLTLAVVLVILLAVWIVPRVGAVDGRLQDERQPVLTDNMHTQTACLV